MPLLNTFAALHNAVFTRIERAAGGWFLGLTARIVFSGVLLLYYLNSFNTKIGEGVAGFFSVQDGAYFQILPSVVEAYDFDAAAVPFFPYDIIVFSGTYAEFLLPILITIGLLTRLASLGMIGFVVVQSFVDINFHGVDEKTAGALFDRLSGSTIWDQRTLWVFVLLYLAVKGAGALSVDGILARRRAYDD